MTLRQAAIAAALTVGLAIPASTAFADYRYAPADAYVPTTPYGGWNQGSYGHEIGARRSWNCAPSSAAEGNANQQNRIVKQYGQTSGGSAC